MSTGTQAPASSDILSFGIQTASNFLTFLFFGLDCPFQYLRDGRKLLDGPYIPGLTCYKRGLLR